jgi:hypothetical protein
MAAESAGDDFAFTAVPQSSPEQLLVNEVITQSLPVEHESASRAIISFWRNGAYPA